MVRRIAARAAMLLEELRIVVGGLHVLRGRGVFTQVVHLLEGAPDPLREVRCLMCDMKAHQPDFHGLALAGGALRAFLNPAGVGYGCERGHMIKTSPELLRNFAQIAP